MHLQDGLSNKHQYTIRIFRQILYQQMSRRNVSPIRAVRSETDPRDAMIRKLKEDLVVARGREKQIAIMEDYLMDLIEKTKLLKAETVKADEEGKLKVDLTLKTIYELKKDLDALRNHLRNITYEFKQIEEEADRLKAIINSKLIEIQKLRKDAESLNIDSQKLLNQHYRLRALEEQMTLEIKKLTEIIRDYEDRLMEMNSKILEVKAYINQISEKNSALRQKLQNYEHENAGMGNDVDLKQDKIDNLQKTFSDKHEVIKNQVSAYIELQNRNEKTLKEIKHKLNLIKLENEKANELAANAKRAEKAIADKERELFEIRAQSSQINQINKEFLNTNDKFKQDLIFCQDHLQNLIQHNAFIQEEMENFVREDDAIISVIRTKRLLPVGNNFNSLRTSRNEGRSTYRNPQ